MKKNSTLPILLFAAVFCMLFACSKINLIKKATTTSGLNWTQAASLSSSTVHKLAVSGSTVYAASSTGLYSSTNNGSTWTLVGGGLPTGVDFNNIAVNGSNIYVASSNGLYYSTNSGTSWTATTSSSIALAVALAVSGNNLFASDFGYGVSLSTDNGSSWTTVNSGLPSNGSVLSLTASGSNIFAGVFINNGTGGAPGTTIYLSTNNGSSWTALSTGLPPVANLNALTVNGNTLYAGILGYTSADVSSGSGIYLSTNNGSTWAAVGGSGLPSSLFNTVSLATSGSNIFAGFAFSGVYRSTNNGSTWTKEGNALTGDVTPGCIVIVGNTIIIGDGFNTGGIYTATF